MTEYEQVLVFPAAVPAATCDAIIAAGSKLIAKRGQIDTGDSDEDRFKVRNARTAFFVSTDAETKWIFEEVMSIFDQANQGNWQFHLSGVEPIQYSLYGPGEYYGWHNDDMPPKKLAAEPEPVVRKLSLSIQLTDPAAYHGGDFEVHLPGAKQGAALSPEARRRGSVLLFPSNVRHRVTMVTSGERISLVAWALGRATDNQGRFLHAAD